MLFTELTISQMNDNPLYHTLGIRIEKVAEGQARSRLEPRPEVCWPFPGQPHGGILFTLMDTTMAWAVLSQTDPRVQLLNHQSGYSLHTTGQGKSVLLRSGDKPPDHSYSFVRSEIHDADGKLMALARQPLQSSKWRYAIDMKKVMVPA